MVNNVILAALRNILWMECYNRVKILVQSQSNSTSHSGCIEFMYSLQYSACKLIQYLHLMLQADKIMIFTSKTASCF